MALPGIGLIGNVVSGLGTAAHTIGNALPGNSFTDPAKGILGYLGQEHGVSEAITDPRRSILTASPGDLTKLTNSPLLYPGMPGYGTTSGGTTTDGSNSGGTVLGSTLTPTQQAQLSNFGVQHQTILGSASDAAQNAAQNQYGVGVLDFLNSLKQGQNQLNNQGTQLELARQQGGQDIRSMVGRGIQSGGVMLANRNAADSSAAGAIAKAYGDLGQRQLSQVGNQYAQGQDQLNQQQASFNDQQNLGALKLGAQKNQIVNSIVDEANNKLAALDGQMATAGIGDRINLAAEKENIKQAALQQLRQYDELLSQGLASQAPATAEQNRTKAGELARQGVAATNPFQFTEQAPTQFQGTGPFSGNLPLFTLPRNKQSA